MPGFDGTGPMGAGPMTGWSRGYCNPSGLTGYGPVTAHGPPVFLPRYRGFAYRPNPGLGFGRGRGFGRDHGWFFGRGYGRGFGRGFGRRGVYPAWGGW